MSARNLPEDGIEEKAVDQHAPPQTQAPFSAAWAAAAHWRQLGRQSCPAHNASSPRQTEGFAGRSA